MKVYRFEKNGYGIFCSSETEVLMPFTDDALYSRFGFTCKQRYKFNSQYRSACESLEKLMEYFGSDFHYILEQGASLIEYNIHKAHVRFGMPTDTLEDSIEVAFKVDKVLSKQVLIPERVAV